MINGSAEVVELAVPPIEQIVLEDGPLASVDRDALARLVEKRLQRFLALLPKVMGGDGVEAVHDVRVWSRRLQQSLVALFPKPRRGKIRRLRRTLRRVRRSLGEWRNCDVVLELVARKQRRTRSRAKKQAWQLLIDHLREKRDHESLLAQKKLLKYELSDLAGRAQRLLNSPDGEGNNKLVINALHGSIESAWERWHSALAQSRKTRQAGDVHAFRIATKRLRYRIELARDLGDEKTRPLFSFLKKLQAALGVWHDRQTLHQAIAETMARRQFLLRQPDAARLLLAELQKDRLSQNAAIDQVFRLAGEYTVRRSEQTQVDR
jgi:CHAD domain-containing protein